MNKDIIKIEPGREPKIGAFSVILLSIIAIVMFYRNFGISTLYMTIPMFLLACLACMNFFFRITLERDRIRLIFIKWERTYEWNDFKTIRYERYYHRRQWKNQVYFSMKKSIRPKWIPSDIVFLPFQKSFNVYLVETKEYETTIDYRRYPKYEFLDKLHEWGIRIDIDEKYIEEDPSLRKYTSIDESSDYSLITDDNKYEAEYNNQVHIIKVNEDDIYYHIIIDDQRYKSVEKENIKKWGHRERIILGDDEFYVSYENDKLCIMKDNQYLEEYQNIDYTYNENIRFPETRQWIIENGDNRHVLKVGEDDEYYYYVVDDKIVGKISILKMKLKAGNDYEIILDGERYIIACRELHFGVAHNGRYIHNNRSFRSYKLSMVDLLISIVLFAMFVLNAPGPELTAADKLYIPMMKKMFIWAIPLAACIPRLFMDSYNIR